MAQPQTRRPVPGYYLPESPRWRQLRQPASYDAIEQLAAELDAEAKRKGKRR